MIKFLLICCVLLLVIFWNYGSGVRRKYWYDENDNTINYKIIEQYPHTEKLQCTKIYSSASKLICLSKFYSFFDLANLDDYLEKNVPQNYIKKQNYCLILDDLEIITKEFVSFIGNVSKKVIKCPYDDIVYKNKKYVINEIYVHSSDKEIFWLNRNEELFGPSIENYDKQMDFQTKQINFNEFLNFSFADENKILFGHKFFFIINVHQQTIFRIKNQFFTHKILAYRKINNFEIELLFGCSTSSNRISEHSEICKLSQTELMKDHDENNSDEHQWRSMKKLIFKIPIQDSSRPEDHQEIKKLYDRLEQFYKFINNLMSFRSLPAYLKNYNIFTIAIIFGKLLLYFIIFFISAILFNRYIFFRVFLTNSWLEKLLF